MERIDLKTGFSCNNRCRFCVQGDKRKHYRDKGTAELKKLLDEGRAEADAVVLTGGEVTIRKDLPELVAHARDAGYKTIQIQTNGRMLADEAFTEALVQAGATEFSPALHGPTEQIHDTLTQAPGAFRQTVRGIMIVRRLGMPVVLNSVITQANVEHLREMAMLFVRLGVSQYQFAFVHALGSAEKYFDEIVPRLSAAEPHIHAGLAVGRDAGVRCMTEAVPLCFLRGFESFAAEWIIPRTKVIDAEWSIPDYTEYRLTEGKAKGEPCRTCRYAQVCEGPWHEYVDRFGWDEFKPVPPAGKPEAMTPAGVPRRRGGQAARHAVTPGAA